MFLHENIQYDAMDPCGIYDAVDSFIEDKVGCMSIKLNRIYYQ